MIRSFSLAASVATLLAFGAAPASAQITVLSQGENFSVHRDAIDTGNIVGGGSVDVLGRGENARIHHRDPAYTERAPGIPVAVGGSNGDIVYVAPSAPTSLAARSQAPSPG
ncbi:hypothetical protein ACFOD4_13600 [Pseudoroseomonas globiformis]|uniref:Uncharacterized protein n=1 Tax=Teichococcus globiformis TaxID=2307229 RepID=A0ABV7G501_9PROT